MFKKDKSLNEQRLDCVIKSMALTAYYISCADKKFDQKEKEQAKEISLLLISWNSLFYTNKNEELDESQETQLSIKLKEAIDGLVDKTLDRLEIMRKINEQYEFATTLTKYSSQELEKMSFEELIQLIKTQELDIDHRQYDVDEEGRHYLMLEVDSELNEPFSDHLRDLLAHYGTFIAMASGGTFNYKNISKVEKKSIQEIEIAWGGSELSASSIMEHARKIYKIRKQIRENIKKVISI
jgi:hypothetical protein